MQSLLPLFSSIYTLPGVANITGKLLEKLCGGGRIIDLLFHVPQSYIDRRKKLSKAKVGDVVTFIATVVEHLPGGKRGRKVPYKIIVNTDIGKLTLIFFNYSIKYLLSSLSVGTKCVISGKLEIFLNQLQITHPDTIINDIAKFDEVCCIEPVYPLIRGLTSKNIASLVKFTIKLLSNIPEWLNSEVITQQRWASFINSLIGIHNPSDGQVNVYRSRLAYDELLSYYIVLNLARFGEVKERGLSIISKGLYHQNVLKKLNFQLTEGQKKVIKEITSDQLSDKRMMRLLQGDVGSGKTVVALFVALNVIENNKQVALMAPTEILAEQHYKWFSYVLADLGINLKFLTGKTKKSERNSIKGQLEQGECQIIIGTHALFQEGINFKDLGLVIIDEQQRFGVLQRTKLIEKGKSADALFMTATPIPRTLEQVVYGDMDCSRLTEKPSCRVPIRTTVVNLSQIENVVLRLKKAIEEGHKAYWICPYIESSEVSDIAAVEKRFFYLKEIFQSKIDMIHGRISQTQRDAAMVSFLNGDIRLLVATTVIEVGIDVPDATIIIIENAEQFGLSQLHQLRGRVGRSDQPSFCILLYDNIGKLAYKKLAIMSKSQDGFYIAEQDLLLRGSGNVLGLQQSGLVNFKFVNIFVDQYLIKSAQLLAKEIVRKDPSLSLTEHKNLRILLSIFGYDEIIMRY